MAAIARQDQQKRTVIVRRDELLKQLELNRKNHIAEYDAAMAGYTATLTGKLDVEYEQAKVKMEQNYQELRKKIEGFKPEDIAEQSDHFLLFHGVTVKHAVPRSYVEEYDSAIEMMKWETREEIELTHAEFTCFVRDKWDWTSDFFAVTKLYNAK